MLRPKARINNDWREERLRTLQIGENLWNIRKAKWISQQNLAKNANTTQNIISKIEDGTYNPWSELLMKLSSALKIDEEILLKKWIDWHTNEILDLILKKAKSVWKEYIDILWITKLFYFIDLSFKEIKGNILRNTSYTRYYAWPYDDYLYKSLNNNNYSIFVNKCIKENLSWYVYLSFQLNNGWMDKYSILNNEEIYLINKILDKYINYSSEELKVLSYNTIPMKEIGATIWGREWLNQVILSIK